MPKVSVVIPCYNHGAFLMETLDSLQAQTCTDYEVIVVNDGSTDASTIAVLQSLKSEKIRVFHTTNQGVSAARNRGIEEAQGDYILPLDADDKIGPDYLMRSVDVLESRPDVAIVYGERVLFGEREGMDPLPDYNAKALLIDNCIYPAALFRKTDWKMVGGYSEKMTYGWEDWDFWISLSELNKQVVKIPEIFFYYRVRSSSRDHSIRFHQKILLMLLIVLRHKRLYLCNLDLLVKRIFTLLF
ncbi:MAG: glycosyltransferase family 2 protein [Geobacteraceae bacterium]|nr:glycosyltransferase family 2 protein [Geobacteraceae bacterium]NTW79439.1 glycosyltransferase family 2 protein [Geobacteraceae bacterium]